MINMLPLLNIQYASGLATDIWHLCCRDISQLWSSRMSKRFLNLLAKDLLNALFISMWWSSQHRVPNHNATILYDYDTYTGFPAFAGDYRTLHWVSFQADDDLSIFNSPICAIYVEKHVGSIFVKNVDTKKTWQMTSRIFLIDVLIQTPSLGVVADVERFHIVCQQGIASRLGEALV